MNKVVNKLQNGVNISFNGDVKKMNIVKMVKTRYLV